MSTYFEKITTPSPGGVNPYGQPDRKNTVFFTTALINQMKVLHLKRKNFCWQAYFQIEWWKEPKPKRDLELLKIKQVSNLKIMLWLHIVNKKITFYPINVHIFSDTLQAQVERRSIWCCFCKLRQWHFIYN